MAICPSCGSNEPDSSRFCGMCGAALNAPAASAPSSSSADVDQGSAVASAQPIPPVATATLSVPLSQIVCPKCGTANKPSERFCKKCWTPLSGKSVTTPDAPSVSTPAPSDQEATPGMDVSTEAVAADAESTAPVVEPAVEVSPPVVAPPSDTTSSASITPPSVEMPAPADPLAATARITLVETAPAPAATAAATPAGIAPVATPPKAARSGFSIRSIGRAFLFFMDVMYTPAAAYQKALSSGGSWFSLIIPLLTFAVIFSAGMGETFSNRIIGYVGGAVIGIVFGPVVIVITSLIAHGVSFIFGHRGGLKESVTIVSGSFAAGLIYAILGILAGAFVDWHMFPSFAMVGLLWALIPTSAGFRTARVWSLGALITGLISTALVIFAWVGATMLLARFA